ncbi:hypothetical protein LKM01_18055 [Bacillus pacificus]|nr:hypothetical protein [Bacillus pacificus]
MQRAEQAFDNLERRINSFNPSLNINDIELDTSTVERGLRTLESQIQSFNPTVTISGINLDTSAIERKLAQLEQRITNFNPQMNISRPDLDTSAIESRLSALERRVESVDIGGGIERRARSSLRRAEEPFNDFYDYLDAAARRMENRMHQFRPSEIVGQEMQRTENRIRAFSPSQILDQEIQRMNNSWSRYNPELQLERQMRGIARSVAQPIINLPDHLRPFREELARTRFDMQTLGLTSRQSLDELSSAAVRSQVSLSRMMSATSSGKAAARAIQELGDTTRTTQLAILGLSRDGRVQISTEESQRQMQSFNQHVARTREQLERLRAAGDMASYNEGMRQLERQMQQVDRAMRAAAQGGQAYTDMLDRLGIHTANAANRAAIAMEGMREGFMRSIDHMNAMKTQSQKMMDALGDTSSIQRIDRAFLQVGNSLEMMARRGTAANIALRQLGPNASMKDLMDRVRLINTGLMRMQQLALVAGIALAGFTAVMAKASFGPDPAEIRQQQADITKIYEDELQQRSEAIYNASNLFKEMKIEPVKSDTLMKNLDEQVGIYKRWVDNMKSLSARIPVEMKEELYKMGPEAAAEIKALNGMSEPELSRYVELWREKHRLAREAALDELGRLREETKTKIKELEESLKPLGIAWEKFKGTWADALAPFVEIWGKVAAVIVDAGTKVGEFIVKMNEINPSITAAVGMFTFLFTAMVTLLAPMAIGIGRAEGMAAAFNALWMVIQPVALGFLRVAGMASLVAGAIVVVGGSIMKMWEYSENFRNSITNAWSSIQSIFGSMISSIAADAQRLFDAFMRVINLLVGGGGSSSTQSFWKSMGDGIAKVIDLLSGMFMPMLSAAGSVISNTFSAVVDVFSAIFKAIEPAVSQVRTFIGVVFEAFSALSGGGSSLTYWEVLANIFNFLVNIIRDVLVVAIQLLGAAFSQHFSNVITILTAVVQAFVFVVEKVREFGSAIASIFNGDIGAGVNILEKLGFSPSQIQTIITSVTQVKVVIRSFIDGVIQGFTQAYTFVKALFDFFTGNQTSGVDLLKQLGMSDDTIQKVSSIVEGVKSALNSLWSFFSSSILPILQDIGSAMLEGLTGIVTGIVEIVSGIIQVFFGWLSGDVESWKQGLKSIFDGVVTIVSSVFSTAFEIWKGIFQIGLEILASIWGALVDWISPYIQAVIDYVSEQWNSLVESTMSILSGIGTFFSELWTQCVETTMSILGGIGTFFSELWTQCVETTMSVLGSIGTFFSELWTQCVETTMSVLGSIGEPSSVNYGRNALKLL